MCVYIYVYMYNEYIHRNSSSGNSSNDNAVINMPAPWLPPEAQRATGNSASRDFVISLLVFCGSLAERFAGTAIFHRKKNDQTDLRARVIFVATETPQRI